MKRHKDSGWWDNEMKGLRDKGWKFKGTEKWGGWNDEWIVG